MESANWPVPESDGLVVHDFVVTYSGDLDALWSVISDTQRLNERAGSPKHEIIERPMGDGQGSEIFGRLSLPGYRLSLIHI